MANPQQSRPSRARGAVEAVKAGVQKVEETLHLKPKSPEGLDVKVWWPLEGGKIPVADGDQPIKAIVVRKDGEKEVLLGTGEYGMAGSFGSVAMKMEAIECDQPHYQAYVKPEDLLKIFPNGSVKLTLLVILNENKQELVKEVNFSIVK